jgi:ATP-dependent DNA ligase
MLARSGPLPASGDYAYEVKWDGFRAIVSTEDTLRVRSRRGWDMTEHVTFLAGQRGVLMGSWRRCSRL